MTVRGSETCSRLLPLLSSSGKFWLCIWSILEASSSPEMVQPDHHLNSSREPSCMVRGVAWVEFQGWKWCMNGSPRAVTGNDSLGWSSDCVMDVRALFLMAQWVIRACRWHCACCKWLLPCHTYAEAPCCMQEAPSDVNEPSLFAGVIKLQPFLQDVIFLLVF